MLKRLKLFETELVGLVARQEVVAILCADM